MCDCPAYPACGRAGCSVSGAVPHLRSTSDEHPASLASTVGHTDAETTCERSLAAKLAAAQAAGASATPGYGKPPGAAASPYPPATGAGHAAAAFPGQQPNYSQQPGQYGGAGGYGGQPQQQQQQQGACRRGHPFGSANINPGKAELIEPMRLSRTGYGQQPQYGQQQAYGAPPVPGGRPPQQGAGGVGPQGQMPYPGAPPAMGGPGYGGHLQQQQQPYGGQQQQPGAFSGERALVIAVSPRRMARI